MIWPEEQWWPVRNKTIDHQWLKNIHPDTFPSKPHHCYLKKKNIIYIQYAFIYLLMEMGKVTSEDTRHWEGLSQELVPIFEE